MGKERGCEWKEARCVEEKKREEEGGKWTRRRYKE
jgi:hypothetical protein